MEGSPETAAGRTTSSSSLVRESKQEDNFSKDAVFEWKQPSRRPPQRPPVAAAGVEPQQQPSGESYGHIDTGSLIESEMVVSDGEDGDETPKIVRFDAATTGGERYS